MDKVKTVLQFISDYGITLILAGIVVYIIIRVVNILLKQFEDKVSQKQQRDTHDDLLDKRNDVGNRIQVLINDALRHTNGGRIQVIEFTNSVMSVAYLPFRYMTCSYEAYSLGRQATGPKIDRISTSLFIQFFSKLQDSHHLIFDINDRSCLVGGAMCDLMKGQNEVKALCCPMKSSSGKFIGYTCLTKDADQEFSDEDADTLETMTDQIAILLCIAEK